MQFLMWDAIKWGWVSGKGITQVYDRADRVSHSEAVGMARDRLEAWRRDSAEGAIVPPLIPVPVGVVESIHD